MGALASDNPNKRRTKSSKKRAIKVEKGGDFKKEECLLLFSGWAGTRRKLNEIFKQMKFLRQSFKFNF